MVRCIVKKVKPKAGELGARHVQAIIALAESGTNGKRIQLPGHVEVRRKRNDLVFYAVATGSKSL